MICQMHYSYYFWGGYGTGYEAGNGDLIYGIKVCPWPLSI